MPVVSLCLQENILVYYFAIANLSYVRCLLNEYCTNRQHRKDITSTVVFVFLVLVRLIAIKKFNRIAALITGTCDLL